MPLINLKAITFKERSFITKELETLLMDPIDDAYSLSMILLTSAQLGSEVLYKRSLEKMNLAMEKVERGPFQAWLYGRILFAAYSFGDESTVSQTRHILRVLLKNDGTNLSKFTTWALGYMAALGKMEYSQAKESMVKAATYLTQQYFKVNATSVSNEQKQEARSDSLWAWIMIIQAAANADDKVLYQHSLDQMMVITKQPSISQAITKGLLRTYASSDYPAWAIAIIRLATQKMADKIRFDALEMPLANAIREAKSSDQIYELLLAKVNAQLAVEREK